MRVVVTGKRRPVVAAEEGWALVETLMSAVVLIVVVLGVYSALDSSTHAAGFDRQRSTAAALAEQDLERMRGISASGFSSDFPLQRQKVDGTTYDIQSKAAWVYDSTGAEESSTDTTQATYLKISSTVTPETGPGAGIAGKPVTMSSLMSPSVDMTEGRGTLAVRLLNSTGAPLANTQVSLNSGDSRMTNDMGCAVFGFIPTGNYTVQAPASLVDKGGVAGGAVTANVTENAVKTVQLQVDTPATLTVSVQTKLQNGSVVADRSSGIVAANTQVPTGFRQFPATANDGTETLGALFPFSTGYTVYSGTCLSADPAKYSANYYATFPGVVTLAPGGTASLTVREPALNIKVTRSGSVFRSAKVVAYSQSGDCVNDNYTFNSTRSSTGLTTQGGLPAPGPGLPYGDYKVCATDGTRFAQATVSNYNPDGTAPTTLAIPTSGTSALGTCP